jgi:putative transposase
LILTEQHIIKKTHEFYKECDNLCFLSKNLYNKANYIVRQEFIQTTKDKQAGLRENANYLNYTKINRKFVDTQDFDYTKLPRKVSNQTLMLLDNNWTSFFATIKDWNKFPSKYKGKPNIPKYLNKTKGRYILTYELGAISKPYLKKGIVSLSQSNIKIPFINKENEIKVVRIVPKNNQYIIEIVYEKKEKDLKLNKGNVISIDLGINNLMTLTSNKKGYQPILVNGREIKSTNQYYNKMKANLQSKLITNNNAYTSKRISKLTNKRNNKIKHMLHVISHKFIEHCIKKDVGTIVIGKNDGWKDSVNLSAINNQKFVDIPFNQLIEKIEYKGKLVGLNIIITEESYTSKASFLDLDEIPVYDKGKGDSYKFSGYRKYRGLYKVKGRNVVINADVNGSYNILRKVFPNTYVNGIEGLAVVPVKQQWFTKG